MRTDKEILNSKPCEVHGIDKFYGYQTVINAMNEYLNEYLIEANKAVLRQPDVIKSVCPKCGDMGRCEPRTLESPDGQECDCGQTVL